MPDETGQWIDVDPTVTIADDGTLRTAATVSNLEFGSAGDTAFVTATNADGEQVALTWDAPPPEPVVEGSTVTYPEVLPDVDLEVYAGTAEFSYALVVKSPEASENAALARVELGMEVKGLTVDADTATALLTDASGKAAFSVAQPWMWDSSESEATSLPEQAAPMDLEIDADSLTVGPDQDLLADPATEYPVYIDPQFSDTTAATEEVFSQRTGISCGTTDELCVGAQIWEADNALGYWRSAILFNGLGTIRNRAVQQATVWITQTHTGDAGGPNQTVRLYSMDYIDVSSTVSWETAKLTVWHAPFKPTQLLTDDTSRTDDVPGCSTSAPGPTINTLTPTLKATAPTTLILQGQLAAEHAHRPDHPGLGLRNADQSDRGLHQDAETVLGPERP